MRERDSPQVLGRYAVYGKIAAGGMATVHLGRLQGSVGFSRTVALKRLHPHLAEQPEFLKTMIDEARLAARVHHPNVVPTLDVVAVEGELLVVMEYVRGEALSRLLRAEVERGRRVPLSIASAIVVGALHGLHAAHEATSDTGAPLGIVHRDVSPPNILVGVDGVARVIDFGVAKAAGRLQTTSHGVIKGKMSYMAPEQLVSQPVTRRVDVYAMSVVLWEMLAGRKLYDADADGALYGQVLEAAAQPPSQHTPDLPPELDALVMKGLAREADDRFATARAMADELVRIVAPAFSTTVGAWVEEVAGDALRRRAALLAEVESSRIERAPSMPFAKEEDDTREEIPNVALQRSGATAQSSYQESAPRWRRGLPLAALVGVGTLVLAVALFMRGATSVAKGAAQSSSGLEATSSAPSVIAAVPRPDVPDASSSTMVPPRPVSPTNRPRPPARKPPQGGSPGPLVYPQPD